MEKILLPKSLFKFSILKFYKSFYLNNIKIYAQIYCLIHIKNPRVWIISLIKIKSISYFFTPWHRCELVQPQNRVFSSVLNPAIPSSSCDHPQSYSLSYNAHSCKNKITNVDINPFNFTNTGNRFFEILLEWPIWELPNYSKLFLLRARFIT